MGYTTEFEGRFECCRPESEEMAAFFAAIREGDRLAPSALADWLSEHNDPRGAAIAALGPQPMDDPTAFWRLFGLTPEHAAYLKQFNRTRRMRRAPKEAKLLPDPHRKAVGLPLGKEAGYFVGCGGNLGQDEDESVLDYNSPPAGQPGLWCQWAPTEDGTAIVWDGGEKFYDYVAWLTYLIAHFLAPWGYVLNGQMTWQGEEKTDRGVISVSQNEVTAEPL